MHRSFACSWSIQKAACHCLVVSTLYVAVLYILIPSKFRSLPREHTTHVSYRMAAASIGSVLGIMLSYILLPTDEFYKKSFMKFTGLSFDAYVLSSLSVTLFLMLVFYLGQAVCSITLCNIACFHEITYFGTLKSRNSFVSPLTIAWENISSELASQYPVILFRNLIFAPISEELVFRAMIVPSMFLALRSPSYNNQQQQQSAASLCLTTALVSTAWFGVAHMHHLYEKLRQGETISRAVISTLVQFTYTSIFGFIASILFMRTGSIYPAIISHMICNYVGLPETGFLFVEGSPASCLYAWRWILMTLHLVGLVLFFYLLFPLTAEAAKQSLYFYS
jgi:membrane protease YdiL (CAAX protease family)